MRKANDWQTLMTKTGTVLILSSACGGIRRERAKGTSSYTRRIIALQGFSLKAPSSKVLDARRRGATTEAYGAIRRKEERSKATPQMMP